MDMKPPIFVRELSTQERKALEDSLRSSNAFVLRRCQILLASARGEIAPRIAENLGCGQQTVRNAIHEFNERGLKSLTPGSSRPKEVHAAFDQEGRGRGVLRSFSFRGEMNKIEKNTPYERLKALQHAVW